MAATRMASAAFGFPGRLFLFCSSMAFLSLRQCGRRSPFFASDRRILIFRPPQPFPRSFRRPCGRA
jgi:hypothetical protein